MYNYYGQFRRHQLCLILTTTERSKHFLAAMKRPRCHCTVRTQPTETNLLYCLLTWSRDCAGLVPQRGARDPEYLYDAKHNIYKHTSRNKYSVSDRMSRTLNRNAWENKLDDKKVKRNEESKILRCRADSWLIRERHPGERFYKLSLFKLLQSIIHTLIFSH